MALTMPPIVANRSSQSLIFNFILATLKHSGKPERTARAKKILTLSPFEQQGHFKQNP
jgi:hypothetical protein